MSTEELCNSYVILSGNVITKVTSAEICAGLSERDGLSQSCRCESNFGCERLRLKAIVGFAFCGPLAECGEHLSTGCFADLNQFRSALEIVKRVSGDIGLDDQVRVLLPHAVHVRHGDRETLTDHFEDVSRCSLNPMRAEVNGGHAVGAHLFERLRGYGMTQQPIDHHSSIHVHRQEDTGIGATGAHRIHQWTFGEHYRFTGHEVSGGNCEGNA